MDFVISEPKFSVHVTKSLLVRSPIPIEAHTEGMGATLEHDPSPSVSRLITVSKESPLSVRVEAVDTTGGTAVSQLFAVRRCD